MKEATSNDKTWRTIHNRKKKHGKNKWREERDPMVEDEATPQRVRVQNSHTTLVLGPGGSREQGVKKATRWLRGIQREKPR